MNGKINFDDALRQRVALLKGVRLSDLERLILNIPYTPGVERLVYILKTLGYKIWNCERWIYQSYRSYKTAFLS